MNEKLMQDLLKSYPSELIEEGVVYLERELVTGSRRLDLVFLDRRKRMILVEVQKDSLDTKHIDRHIDFVEGFVEKNPEIDLRLMYIANRIDPLRKSFLEKRGYEYLEIPMIKFMELAKRLNISSEEEETFENIQRKTENMNLNDTLNISQKDIEKRKLFVSNLSTSKEKEFWKLFFTEIDKRDFVKAVFSSEEFGLHIHNSNKFNSSGGKYSLMFTRKGSFRMNDLPYEGKSWNGLNRLKHWCISDGLPERFYADLKSKKLLVGEFITVKALLNSFTPVQVTHELFQCIDLFQ